MKIKIQETGEIREIEIIDPHTEKDCIHDVIGNCGERYDWDDETMAMVMPQEVADWWIEYAEGYATTEAEIDELYEAIDRLSEDEQEQVLGKFKSSEISRWDVSEYVYDDNHDDLDSQRSIAIIRIQELLDAIKDCYLATYTKSYIELNVDPHGILYKEPPKDEDDAAEIAHGAVEALEGLHEEALAEAIWKHFGKA